MNIKKVLIIYKTHLDIGFTDYAAEVTDTYMNVFLPNAIKTAKALRQANGEARFKWTTGSWLIWEYLRQNNGNEKGKALEQAINNGDICWHALPCTTHTEFMDKELFEYGVSLSKELDKRFGKTTVAAKMTDVPGHTKAMIPLLKKAGITMLHIGVNPASAVPEVPEIFKWQADNGDFIYVIYNGEYGNFTLLGDTGVALYFAHTNDNLGGQTPEEVIKTYKELHKLAPGAELVAATLDDAAAVLETIGDSLPVITDEFGDSWIHGVATDPKKISCFKGLEQLWESLPQGKDKALLARYLLMIPEHTWGMDIKTHLHDWCHYSPADLAAHRADENFVRVEKSWQEQRNFLWDAVQGLSDPVKQKALAVMEEAQREPISENGFTDVYPGENIRLGDYVFNFNRFGNINFLKYRDTVLADEQHLLCTPLYEQYCYDNYITFHKRYHRIEDPWAWEDFTKVGMQGMCDEKKTYKPTAAIYTNGSEILIQYEFCQEASTRFGAPKKMDLRITPEQNRLLFDLAWFEKQANRGAESLWFGFHPIAQNRRFSKLDTLIDIGNTVSRGNRNLLATDKGVFFDRISILTRDTALVSPQLPCVLDYPNTKAPENEGIYFGLYNNIWATNFPMWYDENARFRFTMVIE